MKVIDLPLARLRNKKDKLDLLVQKINPEVHAPLYGPWQFTCINCGHLTTLHTSGLILKHLDFFCSGCGTPWRISNPALISKTQPAEIIRLTNSRKSS
jgi:hypothetical protein